MPSSSAAVRRRVHHGSVGSSGFSGVSYTAAAARISSATSGGGRLPGTDKASHSNPAISALATLCSFCRARWTESDRTRHSSRGTAVALTTAVPQLLLFAAGRRRSGQVTGHRTLASVSSANAIHVDRQCLRACRAGMRPPLVSTLGVRPTSPAGPARASRTREQPPTSRSPTR